MVPWQKEHLYSNAQALGLITTTSQRKRGKEARMYNRTRGHISLQKAIATHYTCVLTGCHVTRVLFHPHEDPHIQLILLPSPFNRQVNWGMVWSLAFPRTHSEKKQLSVSVQELCPPNTGHIHWSPETPEVLCGPAWLAGNKGIVESLLEKGRSHIAKVQTDQSTAEPWTAQTEGTRGADANAFCRLHMVFSLALISDFNKFFNICQELTL